MSPGPGKFLTAEWRDLLMLNFEISPDLVRPFVPRGVELDFWSGRTFISIVGFRFLRTRVLGIPFPRHRNFDEVNLRFYVRCKSGNEWRRGVVFIKEIVPRWIISFIARKVYNENYVTRPMRDHVARPGPASDGQVRYEWKEAGRWHLIGAATQGEPRSYGPGSEEAFITEHYWGYTRQRDGGTIEYGVEHPPWRIWRAGKTELDCDLKAVYGPQFAEALQGAPSSAFVAEGSPIAVRRGTRLA
jgi:uncharacterized protein YqjF (DUF2071 family)